MPDCSSVPAKILRRNGESRLRSHRSRMPKCESQIWRTSVRPTSHFARKPGGVPASIPHLHRIAGCSRSLAGRFTTPCPPILKEIRMIAARLVADVPFRRGC